MKNALTKVDDPTIDAMSVIPLDLKGAPDPNAEKPIDDLIAAAEKNRPDVAMDQAAMQVAQENLKGINSELLPSLNMYGLYAGAGTAGPSTRTAASGPRSAPPTCPPASPACSRTSSTTPRRTIRSASLSRSTSATARPRPISSVPS